jgi:hypothetical protein
MATMNPNPQATLWEVYDPAWPDDVKCDKFAHKPIVIAMVVCANVRKESFRLEKIKY